HLLPRDEQRRRELLCELGVAARIAGHRDQFERFLDEAVRSSLEAGDRRLELRARIELEHARMFDDATAADRVLELATSAIPTLEAAGDDRGLGRAWLVIAVVLIDFKLQNAKGGEGAARAVSDYQRGGWSPSTSLGTVAGALFYGPCPVKEAIARCEELLAEHAGDRASEANVLLSLGKLEAMECR